MKHIAVWNQLLDNGMEYCSLELESSIEITGKVIRVHEGERYFVEYTVNCDQTGSTEEVHLYYRNESMSNTVIISRDGNGCWTRDGQVMEGVSDAKDIDIGITPSTNILPIRRLQLAVGESAEVITAWVRFPEFDVQPLKQEYTRINHATYRYRSIESGYTAILKVDERGIVEDYEDEWIRL
ncbi:putative glycolipid-binding domain-containing protein [Paenibacillus sp. SC116]|uniref:putative glycolipid-binding domain-containing protein n=1 Tax=Paenibacillus sp. SC116 TaxID=2968986 RepID=UPI00215B147A|nr:putative glycolipid-binding domain-containing protein [Paenibacillus sp. SC116]MCR8843867.1 putative glycolipid-binding domain-containing protein [Paenibacillus sp. SC116]